MLPIVALQPHLTSNASLQTKTAFKTTNWHKLSHKF